MSDTPRTDAVFDKRQNMIAIHGAADGVGPELEAVNPWLLCEILERELAAMTENFNSAANENAALMIRLEAAKKERDELHKAMIRNNLHQCDVCVCWLRGVPALQIHECRRIGNSGTIYHLNTEDSRGD